MGTQVTDNGLAPRITEELLFQMVNSMPDIVKLQSPDYQVIYCNKGACDFYKLPLDKIIGVKCYTLLGRTEPCPLCTVREALKSKQVANVEKYISETNTYLDCNATPIFDANGEIIFLVERLQDISERKKAELALRENESKIRLITDNMFDLVSQIDLEGTFLYVTPSHSNLLGYELKDLLGKKAFEFVHPEDFAKNFQRIIQFKDHPKSTKIEYRIRHAKGHYIWMESIGNPLFDESGDVIGAVVSGRDITERKKMEDQVRYFSYHDATTGLYNTYYFNQELAAMDVTLNLPLSIIIGDVNGLKLVNDGFGHRKGDELLENIAMVLKDSCRKQDIVARIGGDEFAILLPNTDEKNAYKIYQRIKSNCQQAMQNPIPLSISLGVSTKSHLAKDIEQVLREAEERMYCNKLLEGKSARSSLVYSLKKTLFEKNFETQEHTERLQKLALLLHLDVDLPVDQANSLVLLAALHDLGKIAIDESILSKVEPLTEAEWATIKKHPEIGYRIAITVPELAHIAEGILAHHERWDGLGYPRKLKGLEIPLIARIISIIDAYDVMTHGRPYKAGISQQEALLELKRCAGSQFDPNLVRAFTEIILNKAV